MFQAIRTDVRNELRDQLAPIDDIAAMMKLMLADQHKKSNQEVAVQEEQNNQEEQNELEC
jgi:hypothetical protein